MELKSTGTTTTFLNWALVVGTVLLLVSGLKYYNKTKSFRTYQVILAELNRLQTAQNIANSLVSETLEYSKTHPAIDPTLEAIGAKPAKSAPTVAKPAGK